MTLIPAICWIGVWIAVMFLVILLVRGGGVK